MKCVSLFSGAGGLDLGLEAAGFAVVASLEMDSDCCDTLRSNGRANVLNEDITSFDFSKLKDLGPIDLLSGGPPCQPFSKSALWTQGGTRGLSDPRTSTIGYYFQSLEALKPKAFVLENVEGFSRWGGQELLEQKLGDLRGRGLNYSMQSRVLNAADFGVPQKRSRYFAIGVRDGVRFDFPSPTHGRANSPYVTAWDACSSANKYPDEILRPKGRWAELLPSIPPGRNYLWHTSRGHGLPIFGWRARYWSFLYKLDPDSPSPTIVASPSQNSGPFHWENRLLTTPELAAIQTFPQKYVFSGGRPSRQRQIGNAVPPLLAEHIGRALMLALGASSPAELAHAVVRATHRPSVPAVAMVPRQYHGYVGDHADHPGTGLGPKPRRAATQPAAV